MRARRLLPLAALLVVVATHAAAGAQGSSELTRCARLASDADLEATALQACLATVPSSDWTRPLYVGLRALLFYRSNSYEAGDFDAERYRDLVPEPRTDEQEAFVLRLGRERTAAVERRHAAVALGESRGRAAAVAEASLAGCRATIDSSGRVVIEEFCSGAICVEGRELERMSADSARLLELERTLGRTRIESGGRDPLGERGGF